jgi:hypothetical protein
MLEKVYHKAELIEKTGYADHRVARHRSRLDFGLTRAQLNLAQKACKPCQTPAAGERFLALANIFLGFSTLSGFGRPKAQVAGKVRNAE